MVFQTRRKAGWVEKPDIIVLVQGFPYNVVLALRCKGTTFLLEEKTQGRRRRGKKRRRGGNDAEVINIKEVGADARNLFSLRNHFVSLPVPVVPLARRREQAGGSPATPHRCIWRKYYRHRWRNRG